MIGWMLIFVLMVLGSTISAVNGGSGLIFGMTSSVVFGFLLVISVLTLILRSRA